MSLVGVFSGLTFDRFPSPIQRFTIYAMLYDGEGEGVIELRIVQMETERDLYRHQRWTKFSGRGMQYQHDVKVDGCVFPAPGRYAVVLRFDGEIIESRTLEILAA
jgi:hypothetical protein